MSNVFYDILCSGCQATKTIESEREPESVKDYLIIANAVDWTFVIDEDNQLLLYFCSPSCVQKEAEKRSLLHLEKADE